MNKYLPKIIAAHDLSGLGKASLSAVMPILSVMGSNVCALPTAVLSTITGVFEGFTITDLTKHMKKTIDHWETLTIEFDYLYSGFLGSPEQVDVIIETTRRFNCSLIVDPVFADHGELYPTMNEDMVKNMRRLVSKASMVTPNLTEAQFLLGENASAKSHETVNDWLIRLCDMGPEKAIITSCEFDDEIHVCAYDRVLKEFIDVKCQYVPVTLHGTGDMFTSIVIGSILRGDSFESGISLAVDFIRQAIELTVDHNLPLREGAAFEKILYKLV